MKVLHNKEVRTKAVRLAAASGVAFAMAFSATPAYAKQVRLFVDPGHGGKDPGAVARGLKEKDSNLAISRFVVKEAKRQGWKVKMSRNSDRFVSLRARPRMAARWRATTTVSIHSNSTGRKSLGNMTIYRTKKSKRLGRAISKELNKTTTYRDIGNRRDVRGLAVLKTKRPTVIVEIMSVTSPKENRRLKKTSERKKLAQAIVRGIAKSEGVKYIPPKKAKPKPKPAPNPSTPETRPISEIATDQIARTSPQTTRPARRPGADTDRQTPRKNAPKAAPEKQAVPTVTVSSGLTTAGDTTTKKTTWPNKYRIETRPTAPKTAEKAPERTSLLERIIDLLVN